MFLIKTKYLKPAAEVGVHREAHLAHFKKYAAAKKLLIGGRKADGTGAYLVWIGSERKELDDALATDPYALHGCAAVVSIDEFAGHLLAADDLKSVYNWK